MIIRELITRLGFQVDDSSVKKYDGVIGGIKNALFSINGLLASAAVVGFGALIKSTISYGEELKKFSQITGIAAETIERLKFSAMLADVEEGALASSLNIFSTKIYEAKEGSEEAIKSFQKIGINPRQIKTTEQGLKLVGDRLSKLQDGFEKTAIARDLFGRGGAQIIPFLNDQNAGSKFEKYRKLFGPKDIGEFAEKSDEVGDIFEVIFTVIKQMTRQMVSGLYPAFEKLGKSILKFFEKNKQIIDIGIDVFVKTLTILFDALAWTIDVVGDVLHRVVEDIKYISKSKAAPVIAGILAALAGFFILPPIFTLVATAARAMWGSIFLPVTLVVAAIGLIILIFDDIIAYLNGDKSVTATIIKKFKEVIEWFKSAWPAIKIFFALVWDQMVAYTKEAVAKIIEELLKVVFVPIQFLVKNPEFEKQFKDGIKTFIDTGELSSFMPSINSAKNVLGGAGANVGAGAGTQNNNLTLEQKIEIKLDGTNPNLTPEVIGEEVKKQTAKYLEREYRNAFDSLNPAEVLV